ncbi:GDSL-type esterase/lipase family protein [Luteolibacter luteus]|uniref:SGNH hydrolase-type esterase domain-containing protein n=1 Tax=Luteolibacter luteus TaxID=2728835 RepID=A0A858RDP0_9BACT|nr:GDSL-type esterase/lipase family protein [Luteolibacter luteus]QJE95196.1 hypothetical protein HHL09_05205 [Luteolibacter luteus]
MTRLLCMVLFCLSPLAKGSGPTVVFLGDSITYDGRWAAWVESQLRHDNFYAEGEIINVGLGSETTSGLSEPGHAGGQFVRPCIHQRLDRVLDALHPDLVIACYGMNDGIYQPLDEGRMDAYKKGMTLLKEKVEGARAQIVFVTPPLFNPDKNIPDPSSYDGVLDAQAAWLKSNEAKGWKVIDIRPGLKAAVASARVANPGFIYAADGVHPGTEGHRFIADEIGEDLLPLLERKALPFANAAAYPVLYRRAQVLRDAWLSETKHSRPGVPEGLPVAEAKREAAKLWQEYRIVDEARISEWSGYERLDFKVDERDALLVRPKQPAKGNPWIWRTEFFGHEPQADLELLARGYHVAYIDVQNMYGAPVAMRHMDALYDQLVGAQGLSKKVTLEGFSRGGLFAFNWAALNPERVTALYVDAPVCDFKSWPGGKGVGPGSPEDWKRCLQAYGLSEAEAMAYSKNPVDQLAPLAKAGIPVLAVIGDSDEVVPVAENIDLVEKRYKELGGKIEVIRKAGGKHHPHSLPDPKPIVDFITAAEARQ